MLASNNLDQDSVRKLFNYDNGCLFWSSLAPKNVRGKRAGTLNADGYRHVTVRGVRYKEHRLVYVWHYGSAPDLIDHTNGVRDDNRIENLRPCTKQQNGFNSNGWSGRKLPKGVCFHKLTQKYMAYTSINGKRNYFGEYGTLEEAVSVVSKARECAHGEFYNHGVNDASR